MSRLPYLSKWFRTRSAIVLHLTNGTVQMNFFNDHVKLILCPLMQAVTVIDEAKNFTTYSFKGLARHGCSEHFVQQRLEYAKMIVERLQVMRSSSATRSASARLAASAQQQQQVVSAERMEQA